MAKHTHPFNGPLSGTTRVSRYQKGKTNLDFTGARDSEQQWYELGHMQVCTSLQTDNHASTSLLKFFTGRMPFLRPNQQRQSTEGTSYGKAQRINSFQNILPARVAGQLLEFFSHNLTISLDLTKSIISGHY